MQYRRFGRTELRMPVLTNGAMRFQQSWKAADEIDAANQHNLEACVRRALELGICHFETARGYGTSEGQLGRILPRLPRDEILVQTKVTPTEHPDAFANNFEDSLRRLRLDHVDLLAIHGLNDEQTLHWAIRDSGCLDCALELKRQGRARQVGFSTHGSTEVILEAVRDGRFDYVNLHYYYVFQDHAPVLVEAAARDMGLLIISPNNKGGKLDTPSAKLVELTDPLSPMAFNDLWLLRHSDVHTLSIGVARPADFDEHALAVERLVSDPGILDVVARIETRLQAEYQRVLGLEWATRWHEGIPSYRNLPEQINVREILRLYNLARAFDLIEYGKMRYNLLGNGGHWFPGYRADRLAQADPGALRDALSGSPFPEQVVAALEEAHQLLAGAPVKRLQQQ